MILFSTQANPASPLIFAINPLLAGVPPIVLGDILLESGSKVLLESGSFLLTENAVPLAKGDILLESRSKILLESGFFLLTENATPGSVAFASIMAGSDSLAGLAGTATAGSVTATAGDDLFVGTSFVFMGTMAVTETPDALVGTGVIPILGSIAIMAASDGVFMTGAVPDVLSKIRPELMSLASYPIVPSAMTLAP